MQGAAAGLPCSFHSQRAAPGAPCSCCSCCSSVVLMRSTSSFLFWLGQVCGEAGEQPEHEAGESTQVRLPRRQGGTEAGQRLLLLCGTAGGTATRMPTGRRL